MRTRWTTPRQHSWPRGFPWEKYALPISRGGQFGPNLAPNRPSPTHPLVERGEWEKMRTRWTTPRQHSWPRGFPWEKYALPISRGGQFGPNLAPNRPSPTHPLVERGEWEKMRTRWTTPRQHSWPRGFPWENYFVIILCPIHVSNTFLYSVCLFLFELCFVFGCFCAWFCLSRVVIYFPQWVHSSPVKFCIFRRRPCLFWP